MLKSRRVWAIAVVGATLLMLAVLVFVSMPPVDIGSSILQLALVAVLSAGLSAAGVWLARTIDLKKKRSIERSITASESEFNDAGTQSTPQSVSEWSIRLIVLVAGGVSILLSALLPVWGERANSIPVEIIFVGGFAAGLGFLLLWLMRRGIQGKESPVAKLANWLQDAVPVLALSVASFVIVGAAFLPQIYRNSQAFDALMAIKLNVANESDLYRAPTPQMRQEYLSRSIRLKAGPSSLIVLMDYKNDLAPTTINNAALVSFAAGEYKLASKFATAALEQAPRDPRFLMTLGLVDYKLDLFKDSSRHLDEAKQNLPPQGSSDFHAALEVNRALANSKLGKEGEAEESFSNSLKYTDRTKPKLYSIILNTKFQIDTDDFEEAQRLQETAHKLAEGHPLELGRVLREDAALMLLKGSVKEAEERIGQAIELHSKSAFELGQDFDQQGQIRLMSSMSKALESLALAAKYYEEARFPEGVANNALLQAEVLIEQGRFDEAFARAAGSIDSARAILDQVGSQTGLGQAKHLEGLAKFRQALQLKKREQVQALLVEADNLYGEAFKIFNDIGYQRGLADVDKDRCTLETEKIRQMVHDANEEKAISFCKNTIQRYRDVQFKRGEANAIANLGILYQVLDDSKQAVKLLQSALSEDQKLGYKLGEARQYANLGRVFAEQKNRKSALTNIRQACRIMQEIGAEADSSRCENLRRCVTTEKNVRGCVVPESKSSAGPQEESRLEWPSLLSYSLDSLQTQN